MIGIAGNWRGRLSVYRAPEFSPPLSARRVLSLSLIITKWASIALFVFIVLNVLVYGIFYKVSLPFTSVNGTNYSFSTYGSIESSMNQRLGSSLLNLSVQGDQHAVSFDDLGVSFSSKKTFAHTKEVSGFWRLPLVQVVLNSLTPTTPVYDFDNEKLEAQLAKYIQPISTQSRNASIIFPDRLAGEFEVKKEVVGSELSAQTAADQLIKAMSGLSLESSEFEIEPEKIFPAVSAKVFQGKLDYVAELVNREISVTDVNGEEITSIQPENYLRIMGTDGDQIAPDKKKLAQFIEQELTLYFYQAPISRRVDNGVVTAAGKDGTGLDIGHAKRVLPAVLSSLESNSIRLKKRPIKAPVITDGVYPKTNEGLSALLRDFDASKTGDYRFIVSELKPGGLFGSTNAVQEIIPASTYKAFVAMAALKAIDRGEMTMGTMTGHGTIHDCMHEMIHVSTDHCAISIQDHMGWQTVDDIIRDAGMVNTRINNKGWASEKWTTALDEYRLVRGLYDGSLIGEASTMHLINEMKSQMWRSGIPAGSAPATVADKVGFYAGRENDVGIVYAPKGDYAIVAMSHGGSFGEISQLARQVYQFFGN